MKKKRRDVVIQSETHLSGSRNGRAANSSARSSSDATRPAVPFTKCYLASVIFLSLTAACSSLLADLHPYFGNSIPGVDRTTLTGKIMCGYQGWFDAPTDGADLGWMHYQSHGLFEPGSCCIDLWPDVSELDPDEKFTTPFRLANGSTASVFSSQNPKTVLRHFKWMQQFGIDGVFVQRFVNETQRPLHLAHCNVVLDNCRSAANQTGRVYAVMYDLSGMAGSGGADQVIADWKSLVDQMRLTRDNRDKAYLMHRGHPVVAVWGVGFVGQLSYTISDAKKVIDFLKNDPNYGQNTVMIGVPTGWRTATRDAVPGSALIDVANESDIISPWTIGRYTSPASAKKHAQQYWAPDLVWCQVHHKDYLPVVFPGFSWHNMHILHLPPNAVSRIVIPPMGQIPRLKGEFEWTQCVAAKTAGATMLYQAMFDEMDEGTAIFKITNDPPTGKSQFLTSDGLPPDQYLWLAGQAGRLLRRDLAASYSMPIRDSRSPATLP